jgi:hypothetical protein
MPFTPDPKFPDLSRLLESLNESNISIQNNALYQTVKGLIDKVKQLRNLTSSNIEALQIAIDNLTNVVNNISITGVESFPRTTQPFIPETIFTEPEPFFVIPGTPGKDGLDGKTIYLPDCCDEDFEQPPFFGCICGDPSASEFTSTSTGNIDDLDFGNASLIRMNNATLATIRGLKAGRAGQRVTIVSVGAGQVNTAHQNGGSAAANQLFNFVTLGDTPLAAASGFASYMYDGTTQRWRLQDHEQGAWITVAFNAADFTANGAMTWTVAAGDVLTDKFRISGRSMIYSFQYDVTTPGGVANTTLIRAIVGGYTIASASQQPCAVADNLLAETGKCFVVAAGTALNFRRAGNVNWTLGANIAGVFGVLNLELT